MGIGSQLTNLMQLQGPHASNKFLFAVRAIGNHVTQEAQVMRCDYTAELVQIDIHPGGLRISSLSAWRGLLHTETVGAVTGDIEPGQSRDFQAFFRTAVAPVPEAIEAIGVPATFGHETGIHDQGLIMLGGNDFGDGGLVERGPVKSSTVPPCKGPLVIGTVATHITKGGVSREHEYKSQQMRDKLVLWFLGLIEASKYTLEQSHGVPPVSVAFANTTLREKDACGYSSVKTVRSIDLLIFREKKTGFVIHHKLENARDLFPPGLAKRYNVSDYALHGLIPHPEIQIRVLNYDFVGDSNESNLLDSLKK